MADYAVERRAKLLGERIKHARETIRAAVAPEGQRKPFTQQLSQREALAWWRQHRFDDVGKPVVALMSPEQVQELDLALAQANQAAMYGSGDNGVR